MNGLAWPTHSSRKPINFTLQSRANPDCLQFAERLAQQGFLLSQQSGRFRGFGLNERYAGQPSPKSAQAPLLPGRSLETYLSSPSVLDTNSKPWGAFKLLTNGFARPVWMSTTVSWFKLPTQANSVPTGT